MNETVQTAATAVPDEKPVSLADYARHHAAVGMRTHPGSDGSYWLQYEIGTLMRFPIFDVHPPSPDEVKSLYWRRLAPLVTYLLEPTPAHPADALVYVCTNRDYNLKALDHGVQGNVKRGLREFQIRPITPSEVIQHGERAFVDTYRRHGWPDVTRADFEKYLSQPATLCGNRYLGCWKDNELAAFAGLIEVDDWVEVRIRFSTDASLNLRPNDALLFHILRHYLAERGFRTVSAGTSSIDPSANTPGLHRFKVKLGFTAVPVRRLFRFHPALAVFVRRAGLSFVMRRTRRFRRTPKLVLAEYALKHSLGISQDGSSDTEFAQAGEEEAGRKPSAAATVQPQITIRPFTSEDLDEAVRLHIAAFSGFFLSSLGPRFLREFYRSFLYSSQAIGYVARDEQTRVLGTVVGAVDPVAYFRELRRRRWWAFGLASLRRILRRPSTLRRIARAAFYRGDAPPGPARALLSSIAVIPEARGGGVGRALLAHWVEEARRRGAPGCYLTTDADGNDKVNGFYRAMDWRLEHTYTTPEGRRMNRYVLDFA